MGDIQRFQSQPLAEQIVQFDSPPDAHVEPMTGLVGGIVRRWYIIFAVFIIVAGPGVPAIWYLMENQYNTTGVINISSIDNPILFPDPDQLPQYERYKNTQAEAIRGSNVLNRVADDLAAKNLPIFAETTDPLPVLRAMVTNGKITVEPDRLTEYIRLTMTTPDPSQAEVIIDSFLTNYMAWLESEEATGGTIKLKTLEDKKRQLKAEIDEKKREIKTLTNQFGSSDNNPRQEMMLAVVALIRQDLIAITIQRIALEARALHMEKDTAEPMPGLVRIENRNTWINSDPDMQSLRATVSQYENQILIDRQTMTDQNPDLQNRVALLEAFKEKLESRRQKLTEDFDNQYNNQIKQARQLTLSGAKAELAQVVEHENKLREKLEELDTDTIDIGRKQLNIDDQIEELAQIKQLYDRVTARIDEIEFEQDRPARISIAQRASSVPAKGKRKKLAAACGAGGLGLGCFFAFLLAKADKRVKDTNDVVNRAGVRIIGTTTSPKYIDKRRITQQLSDDYQTIRANLGLLNGHDSSKVLVVSSPCMREGKTTFAVNLALSFVQSGEKVLLIDGDLRKPDIAETLNLPRGVRGLQDMLFGKSLEDSVYQISPGGLHVLASDWRNSSDALDLLAQTHTAKCMKNIADGYDHVIIDTPPVLGFADALVWSRMADAVILTCFAEHTSSPDLRDAMDRFDQIGSNVLGAVLNNVRVANSYHRYSYDYSHVHAAAQEKPGKASKRRRARRILLMDSKSEDEKPKAKDSD